MRHITVCAYRKNAHKLRNPQYYARVKVDGRTRDIPLHTESKEVAESWVRLRRAEIAQYHDYLACGERPPDGLLSKLIPPEASTPTEGPVLTKGQLMEEWEATMVRKGIRRSTIDGYLGNVDRLLPGSFSLQDLNRQNVILWLARHDGLKASSRKAYSVSLHEFTKHCIVHHGVDQILLQDWPKVRINKVDRPRWTLEEMRRIIDHVYLKDKVAEHEYRVFFWVLATCGSRQGETYALEWGDIKDNVINFRAEITKFGRGRQVPMDWRIARLVHDLPHTSAKVFPTIGKSQASRYIVLRRAIIRANCPMGNLHTFRHSCSYILYRKTQDIKATALMLGHSPAVALTYYSGARETDQLREVVQTAFEGDLNLPSPVDDMVRNKLW